jgi:hypothetical protein
MNTSLGTADGMATVYSRMNTFFGKADFLSYGQMNTSFGTADYLIY